VLIGVIFFLAQNPAPISVRNEVACPACRIEIVKARTVVSSAADAGLPDGQLLAKDSRGRFFSTTPQRDEVLVYGSAGRFLRLFGRRGQGPGEIHRISDITIGPGDSIWIFHSDRTFLVFDSAAHYARQGHLPGSANTARPLPSGELLYASSIATERSAGLPVHVTRADGTLARSFDVGRAVLDPRCHECQRRVVALGDSGTVWVAWTNRYRLERWSITGRLLQVFDRSMPDFPPRSSDVLNFSMPSSVVTRDGSSPPVPVLTDAQRDLLARRPPVVYWISQDRRGLLWTAVGRYDHEGVRFTVDVIDPRAGVLVASTQLPRVPFMGMWDDAMLWSRRDSPDGYVNFDVWELHLRGQ
jgi:hypothetical protein